MSYNSLLLLSPVCVPVPAILLFLNLILPVRDVLQRERFNKSRPLSCNLLKMYSVACEFVAVPLNIQHFRQPIITPHNCSPKPKNNTNYACHCKTFWDNFVVLQMLAVVYDFQQRHNKAANLSHASSHVASSHVYYYIIFLLNIF